MATTATAPQGMKDKLAAQASLPAEQKTMDPMANVNAWLKKLTPEMARALPKHLTPERMARVALTAIRTTPKLLECSIPSLMAAIMKASQLGLEVGVLGQAHLVPFKKNVKDGNGWKTTYECQLIIGYEGYIDLFYRSGKVQTVYASEVYANDEFHYEFGLNETLKHIPCGAKDRGDITHFYAYVKMEGGAYRFVVWPRERVDAHGEQFSKSFHDEKGPWHTSYPSMGMKTMIRQIQKWIPKSVELRELLEADESVKSDPFATTPDFVPFTEVGPEALPETGAAQPPTTAATQPAQAAPSAPKAPEDAGEWGSSKTPVFDDLTSGPIRTEPPKGF